MNDVIQQTEYEKRIADQIAQYAESIDMHALPEIFHEWSHHYIREPLEQVFGSSNVIDFYVDAYLASQPGKHGRILSVGCGDGSIEVDVAKRLKALGLNFEMLGADLSPILLGQMQQKIIDANVADCVKTIETDLNNLVLTGSFDLIMAQHSLHHIVGLEALFEFADRALTPHGIFATQDMIGRNGHQRWPEARAILEAFWPTLSEKQRYHAQLSRLDLKFQDHDSSTVGFEGIRAQDILGLLLDRFHPARFCAFGGFVDLLVDRGYGPGFDRGNQQDVAVIRWMADLNEILLEAGVIKPTIMMAWFTKKPNASSSETVPEVFYRNRSARFCLRIAEPNWTQWFTPPSRG